MRTRHRLTDLLERLLGELPGPPSGPPPPDPDGRRQADLDVGRAILDAQLQAKGSAAMGGTMVGGDLFPAPPTR